MGKQIGRVILVTLEEEVMPYSYFRHFYLLFSWCSGDIFLTLMVTIDIPGPGLLSSGFLISAQDDLGIVNISIWDISKYT